MGDPESFDGRSARELTRSRLAGLAAKQFGVVSLDQLRRLGLSPDDVRGRVRDGLLLPLHRRVFAVGHSNVVPHGRLIAALLTCGSEAFLSHRTAAAFDRLIAGTNVPPPLRNVHIDGWELDCYWPQRNLAVELDGRPYHVAVADMERDKLKDAKLLRHRGISVLRITGLRLELEPRSVFADVRALTT